MIKDHQLLPLSPNTDMSKVLRHNGSSTGRANLGFNSTGLNFKK